ncbi:MAG: hypothetical protein Q9171_006828 [Xanthocarpia ochracea]
MTPEESNKYCEPICRDFQDWNLPVMLALGGKHGLVESRHQIFNDVEDFTYEDGHDGKWPVEPSTRHQPGGITVTESGVIDYWEIDHCIALKNAKSCPQSPGWDPDATYQQYISKVIPFSPCVANPKTRLYVTMALSPNSTLAALSNLQSHPLSIIRLSESISSTNANPTTNNNNPVRTSDISNSALSNEDLSQPTPTSLAADLSHYRDLFSKLRFSYLEQVTKEKFLRAIVGDPPLIVENTENVELEKQLAEIKAVLKMQKADVQRLVQELEKKGRELAGRYEGVQLRVEVLGRLPGEIEGLEAVVRELRRRNGELASDMGGGTGGMGVERITGLLREKEVEREEVERRVKALQREIPGKRRELEGLKGELKGLERERDRAIEGVREAVRSRETGGVVGDELEIKGRWLSGCEEGLRGLLGVEA